MTRSIHDQLNEYYLDNGIHPSEFNCQEQALCRSHAYQGIMTETKMSMVGSDYGEKYPKIAVISLDPPLGEQGIFTEPTQRTTEYVSAKTETDNYTMYRPNPHWAMTQIIVNDILTIFGHTPTPYAAVVEESYANRPIENVSAYFVHVNIAKCSMNNQGKRQAARAVHNVCSQTYLKGELEILQSDILISQGKVTNEIMGELLIGRKVYEQDLPSKEVLQQEHVSTLWLPMRHPTQQLSKIRKDWPFYNKAIRDWQLDLR